MSSMPPPIQSGNYEPQSRYGTQPQPPLGASYVAPEYQNYTYGNPITSNMEVTRNAQAQQQSRAAFAPSNVSYAPEPRAQVYSSGPNPGYYTQPQVSSGRGQPQYQSQQDYVTPPPQLQQGQQQQQSYFPGRAPQNYEPQDDDMDDDEPDPVPAPITANQSYSGSRHRERERESEREPERHRRKERR